MLSQVRRLIRTEASKRYFVFDQQGEKTLLSHYSEPWQSRNQSRNLKEWLTGCLIVEKRWQTKKENLEAAESYEVWGETLPWTGSGPPALAQALIVLVLVVLVVVVVLEVLALYTEGHQHRYPAKVEGAGCHHCHHHRHQTSVNFFITFSGSWCLAAPVCAIICKAETEFRRKATSVDIWCLKTNGSSGEGMATDC